MQPVPSGSVLCADPGDGVLFEGCLLKILLKNSVGLVWSLPILFYAGQFDGLWGIQKANKIFQPNLGSGTLKNRFGFQ
jgi:hypothetical protein